MSENVTPLIVVVQPNDSATEVKPTTENENEN